MNIASGATEELFVYKSYLVNLCGFDDEDLRVFLIRWNIKVTPDGYPFSKIVSAMNLERKRRGQCAGASDESIEGQLKYEQMQERRIKNQERLDQLVPIAKAKDRMKKTLSAVANMIRYANKLAAPRVALAHNARDCENILVETHNQAVEFLKESCTNVSWEYEGRSAQLGRTELFDFAEENTGAADRPEDTSPVEGEYSGEDRPELDPVSD